MAIASTPKRAPPDILERLSRGATLTAYAAAVVVFFVAPVMALSWRQAPFPGFLINSTLVVNARNGDGWSGRAAGLAPPQAIMRVAGEPVATPFEFQQALQARSVDEDIAVFSRLPGGRVRLFPSVRLGTFSLQDFLSLFWLPYFIGLAYLGIGVWVYLARGRERPGRALAFFCACVAIVAGLLFDVLTTHAATAVWIIAVAMLGGSLISLVMRFPVEWVAVRRRTWLLVVPYIVSAGLAIWALSGLWNFDDPWQYLAARSWCYRYAALACLLFFGVMIYRAPQSRDSAVRRQARLVLVGSFIAFTPVVIWFLAPIFDVPLEFNSLVILPALLLFPITVAVAIMRYRMLQIDALVNRTIVYAVLTAMLAGVFAAAIALSQRVFIAITGEESDAAIVITTLIVAAAVAPARTQVQAWVDRQFREVPTGPLRAFGGELGHFLEMNDPELLTRRLLGEAVTSLGAESGAVVQLDEGRPRTVATHGPWRGQALMSVPIDNGEETFGLLMIGPRRDGRRYRSSEADAVSSVARDVARALQLARLNRGLIESGS